MEKSLNSRKTIKLEYLQHIAKSVAIINSQGEYEIKPTKFCKKGDVVWVLEASDSFVRTKIY